MAHMIPPAAAAAEPTANVIEMIRLTSTPISRVVSMSRLMHRMARPVLVRWMMNRTPERMARVSRGVQTTRAGTMRPATS